jgi:hypothetical protein
MSEGRNQTRSPMSYMLRFIMINALLGISIYEAYKQGAQLTGKVIALYIGMGVLANLLMYFGARARRRMQSR